MSILGDKNKKIRLPDGTELTEEELKAMDDRHWSEKIRPKLGKQKK